MAELEIDMNVAYEFSAMTEAGAQLVALSGPGHVGLVNLGNSCYMNSVLQVGVQTAAPPTLPPCTLVCVGGRGSVGVGGGRVGIDKCGKAWKAAVETSACVCVERRVWLLHEQRAAGGLTDARPQALPPHT